MIPSYFRAIPIATEDTNFLLNASEKKALLNLKYQNRSNDGGLQISNNFNILNKKSFKRVKKFIMSKVQEYTRDILCIENKLCMIQSWSTINKKGSQHHKHAHPNVFVSLVYYVDCDHNSGDLIFKTEKGSIQEGFNFDFNIIKDNEYNSNGWVCKTKPGCLCIFPGHIEHHSSIHQGNNDRIMIGANFFVEGTIGYSSRTDSKMILKVN